MGTINIGIWGRVNDRQGAQYSAALERRANDVGGKKMLYSSNYYNREEWDAIFDKGGAYSQMRVRWDAEGRFPHLFDKTCGGGAYRDTNPKGSIWMQLWSRLGQIFADFML